MRRVPCAVLGFLSIAAALLVLLSLISYDPKDLSILSSPFNYPPRNLIGISGAYIGFVLSFLFGYGSYFIVLYLLIMGVSGMFYIDICGIAKGRIVRAISFLFLLVFLCAFVGIFSQGKEEIYSHSGLTGYLLASFLQRYLGLWGSFIILASSIVVLFWMLVGYLLVDIFHGFLNVLSILKKKVKSFLEMRKKKTRRKERVIVKTRPLHMDRESVSMPSKTPLKVKPEIRVYTPKPASAVSNFKQKKDVDTEQKLNDDKEEKITKVYDPASYRLPSIDLLKIPPSIDARQITEDIEESIHNLEAALSDFGVRAKVVSVQRGPVVTMYELQPDSGVKIQHITTLADDIALAMKSSGVRIVAPIPGRGTVGVEIPNVKKHFVFLREVLEEKAFKNFSSKLALAIGKDVKGDPVVADLKEMPHLLIAGTTGSGKTVCVNSLISSIVFKSKPNEVKFILIDPKKVELAPYRGIPHLLHPIISDAKKAFSALNWAVEEMENRYKLLAEEGARNIDVYNRSSFRMPYIVIIVDELADLMVVARDKIETAIQRLAQLSRAVGIHLILATQRPSVDVVTGVIKANFPARISFKVSSKVDSRTVLDMMGAEKLLGRGDLLFIKPGMTKLIRVQGSFIDDEDTNNLTSFLRSQGGPIYEQGILEAQKKTQARLESDELLDEAIKVVLTTRQASASLLQRRLRVGYTRAARLLDLMESQGIIGPFCGSKAREILVDPDNYLKENKLI